jgi:hypothetical protein
MKNCNIPDAFWHLLGISIFTTKIAGLIDPEGPKMTLSTGHTRTYAMNVTH